MFACDPCWTTLPASLRQAISRLRPISRSAQRSVAVRDALHWWRWGRWPGPR